MISRRLLLSRGAALLVTAYPTLAWSQEVSEGFRLPLFGAQGEILLRLASYETILQANYDRSYFVLRDKGTLSERAEDRARWSEEAERTRGFDIDISGGLAGHVYVVLGGGDPRIIVEEGFMNAAVSFAFTVANLQAFGADLREYEYWIANFYDAAKWGDPIPYFGGFDHFHRFFVKHEFDDFGESFFELFGRTLTSLVTYPVFHEIGHVVLDHKTFKRDDGNINGGSEWSMNQESQADEYAIETCTSGLMLPIEPALIFFNFLNFLRREVLAGRGVSVPATHRAPEERFNENIAFAAQVSHDQLAIKTAKLLFSTSVEVINDAGRERQSFNVARFGDFTVTPGLSDSYNRFYRRSCNLENYRHIGLVLDGGGTGPLINLLTDPLTIDPIGSCTKTFVP